MKMTYEDIEEYRENAMSILNKEEQHHATANAVSMAFNALVCVDQYKWELGIAIQQLNDLGIGFGEKIDGVYLTKEEYEDLLEYKFMYESLTH